MSVVGVAINMIIIPHGVLCIFPLLLLLYFCLRRGVKKMYREGGSRRKLADPGSPGRMTIKLVHACVYNRVPTGPEKS